MKRKCTLGSGRMLMLANPSNMFSLEIWPMSLQIVTVIVFSVDDQPGSGKTITFGLVFTFIGLGTS